MIEYFMSRFVLYSDASNKKGTLEPSSRSFRGSRIPSKKSSISALSISSGYSFVSRPGIYTFTRKHVKVHLKIFFAENKGFYSKGCTGSTSGRARCNLTLMENKNGRNLSFFTGVSEFRSWARCASWAAGDPGLWVRELFWEFLRSFEEFGFVSCAPGAGRLAGDLSTAYPQLSLY